MESGIVVRFESIAVQDQRVRGAADDYMVSVVHLEVRHPDGHWCPGCVATVRHRFRGAHGGPVEVSIQPAEQCAAYAHALTSPVEAYYRDHVGPEGSTIRVGPRGASPALLGTQRVARTTIALSVRDAP